MSEPRLEEAAAVFVCLAPKASSVRSPGALVEALEVAYDM